MRNFEELTESEKSLRSLIFAIETKNMQHKAHPCPLGEEYLQYKLREAKETALKFEIPLVKIDPNEYL